MYYNSCKFINHSLCFNDKRIVYCTVGNNSKNKEYALIKDNYNGEPIDWDRLFEKRELDKNELRKGRTIPSCENCFLLCEDNWDSMVQYGKFNYILFSCWTECNSACRYCSCHNYDNDKDFLIEDLKCTSCRDENIAYDIVPIIKDLIGKNLLSDKAVIDFAGGEPTLYYKFDEAIKLLIDANINKIQIHTNAIIYSKEIEEAVKKGIAEVIVSIDAGTKAVHEKIKRVASYDIVWENIIKYAMALHSSMPPHKNKLKTKYVIVPGYNDDENEIKLWVEKSIASGVTQLIINGDDSVYKEEIINKEKLLRIKEMTDYFIKIVNENYCSYLIFNNSINAYTLLGYNIPDNGFEGKGNFI